ncbi:MAG: hypothetical protein KJ747_00290 [Actinobacteria bacterium]|nr:hypothetical protein [Actinomycetota bacterium]
MTDSQVPDPHFEQAVARYLEAGMPAKHSLSTEAYVARCRELWDSCETDETCRYKALVDPEFLGDAWTFGETAAAYVDPRACATKAVVSPESNELRCTAVGVIPVSSVLGDDAAASDDVEDLSDPTKASEFGVWIVVVLDVLGFERTYRRLGPQRMKNIYSRLMAAAQGRAGEPTIGMMLVEEDAHSPTMLLRPVEFAHFSDTMLLWAPLSEMHASSLVASCADVLIEALSLGIPLRGAIAVGEAIMNQGEGVFLGTPLIDAARLEHAQDWIGISLTRECALILPWLDSSLVIPYTAPCKSGTSDELLGGLVVDWPRRARSRGIGADAALDAMRPPESHRRYYDNATELIDHSHRNQRWNRDDRPPVFLRFLRTSIIRQFLDGIDMPPEAFAMLGSTMLNEGEQVTPSDCFRALLQDGELPARADALPEGPRNYLKNVQEVIAGHGVDLEELMMAALEQRFNIRALTERQQADLATEPSDDNGEWQACMPFLRAVAEGADIPEVPDALPPGTQTILRFAREAAQGQYANVDVEALLAGIFWAASTQTPIAEPNLKRLNALASVGDGWASVANFLRAVADGARPDADLETLADEGAANVVQTVRNMLAVQQAVHCSVADALRLIEPIDSACLLETALRVGRATERNGTDDELTGQINRLERAGSPHDAVARHFHELLESGHVPDIPGGLGADVSLYLQLVSALAFQSELQLPLAHLVSAASGARRSGRALSPFDAAMIGLLGSTTSPEVVDLARYLGLLATAEDEPDISSLQHDDLRAAVEETLADRDLKATPSLEDRIESALRYRKNGCGPWSADDDRDDANRDEEGEIATFLRAVATSPLLPPLPDQIDDQVRQSLTDGAIRALCDPLTLSDLANAVLERRCRGDALSGPVLAAIEALAASGDPLRTVGRFLADLSVRTLWPAIPQGVPRLTLMLLASARQRASEFAGGHILVSRRKGDEGEVGGMPES